MLLLVPGPLREAAAAMGLPRAHVITKVAYKAARAGMITGVLLAVARVSGETAPLLFTALNNQFFSADLTGPMSSLPTVIFQFALSPYKDWQSLAWTGRPADHGHGSPPQHPGPRDRPKDAAMTHDRDGGRGARAGLPAKAKIAVRDLKFFYGDTMSLKGINLSLETNG